MWHFYMLLHYQNTYNSNNLKIHFIQCNSEYFFAYYKCNINNDIFLYLIQNIFHVYTRKKFSCFCLILSFTRLPVINHNINAWWEIHWEKENHIAWYRPTSTPSRRIVFHNRARMFRHDLKFDTKLTWW